MRHGRTGWNAAGRAQGHTDVDLDATGHEQAARMGPVVAALGPALLRCSDLARARDTATYVGKEVGLEPATDPRLREYSLGEREGWLDSEWRDSFPEERAAFEAGDYDVVPGGERSAEVGARVAAACRDLLDATPAGETAVAVSHGGAIRVGVATLLGWPAGLHGTLGSLANCAWVRLGERSYGEGLRLLSWNEQVPTPGFAPPPPAG
ncbi:histidine phosphatase family protein [Nocardioides sp. CFH 31398]|uniref:histidine phosphatase family protein n=1 Tax=Nocardioides sp. CFH 31398 TaxID=2919579 RepID=UPI001F0521EE|nr:histidine phosphatase family protein [Nocardioides sp. CFH 31398]MCH1868399.1 histidine phosphatase family protein [Nocardioides sp. CFH 31398]